MTLRSSIIPNRRTPDHWPSVLQRAERERYWRREVRAAGWLGFAVGGFLGSVVTVAWVVWL